MSGKLVAFKFTVGLIALAAVYAVVTGDYFLSGPRYKVLTYAEMTGETFSVFSDKFLPAGESSLVVSDLIPIIEEDSDDLKEASLSVEIEKTTEFSEVNERSASPRTENGYALKQTGVVTDPHPNPHELAEKQDKEVTTPGSFYVQLSSVRDQARANEELSRLYGDYGELINPRPHSIQEVEIPEKGIYYRVLVGPFVAQPDALELCQSLKSAGQDCLVLNTQVKSKTAL